MNENILTEAGLNNYEASAYDTLIKFRKAPAGKIASQSGVPYSRIYDVLNSLEHKGLVKILPGKTKIFIPTDPESLKGLIENRKSRILQAEKTLDELKKIYDESDKEPVLIASGQKNFIKIIKEQERTQKYDYNIRYAVDPNPQIIQGINRSIARGVDVRNLVREDKETEKNIKIWKKHSKALMKPFENDGVALSIHDNEVLLGLIKSNSTILIRDKAFAKLMQKLFRLAWERK